MEAQDYPLKHFQLMVELATELKQLSVQLEEHGYYSTAFGSWFVVFRCQGQNFRLFFDGKEGELLIERSLPSEERHSWGATVWSKLVGREPVSSALPEALQAVHALIGGG